MGSKNGPIAVVKTVTDAALGAYARSVVEAYANCPQLPNPNPPPAVATAHLDALDKSEKEAHGGGSAAVAACAACRLVVRRDLRYFVAYLQTVLDLMTVADALALIELVNMRARRYTRPNKAELAASPGDTSGAVDLVAKAVAHYATYYWEMSSDQKSWSSLPETTKSFTSVAGLTPGQTYYFRLRTLTRAGKSDYSQVVSLLAR